MSKYKEEYEIVTYSQIKYINIFIVDLFYRSPHFHKDIELCLILDGQVRIRTKECEYSARSGSIHYFNPNELHEIFSDDKGAKILSIQISPSFCKNHFHSLQNIVFHYHRIPGDPYISQQISLFHFCLQTALHYFKKEMGYSFLCIGNLNLLFSFLLSHYPYHTISDEEYRLIKKRVVRLDRILSYIDDHYTEKITLLDIAQREQISTTYLSHFFHDNLNITFQDYISNLRFGKALDLLQNTDMLLLDVCMESGFSDGKYLNKMFFDKYGYTPKEYRKLLLEHTLKKTIPVNLCTAQYIYSEQESLDFLNCNEKHPL